MTNNRIEELSKEAWHKVDVSKIKGRHRAYTKIFAELLVRECAEVGLDSVEDGDNVDDIMRRVHNNILEHFGVES